MGLFVLPEDNSAVASVQCIIDNIHLYLEHKNCDYLLNDFALGMLKDLKNQLETKSCENCEYYCDTFPGTNVERDESICLSQDSNCFNNFVNRDFFCKYHQPKDKE